MPSNDLESKDIFQCRKCGDCCRGYGGTFVTEKEIEKIAGYIHSNPKTFLENYCRNSGGRPVLIQGRDKYCIFWDELCTIHPVKPRMCKTWPFLKSVLVDIDNWNIMASLCPGIRTDVSDNLIKKVIAKEISKNA